MKTICRFFLNHKKKTAVSVCTVILVSILEYAGNIAVDQINKIILLEEAAKKCNLRIAQLENKITYYESLMKEHIKDDLIKHEK